MRLFRAPRKSAPPVSTRAQEKASSSVASPFGKEKSPISGAESVSTDVVQMPSFLSLHSSIGDVPTPGIATNLFLVSGFSDLCGRWALGPTEFELLGHNGFGIILLLSTASIEHASQPCLNEANFGMESNVLISVNDTSRSLNGDDCQRRYWKGVC
jgi:hypothetical protein